MYPNRKFFVVCLLGVSLFVSACTSREEKKSTYFEKGNALLAQGELEDAEHAFLKAISMDKRYGEAYIKLGITKMRQGDLGSAFAAFSKAAEIDPNNIPVQLRVATFYMLGRNFPKALRIVNGVLQQAPTNMDALFLKGALLMAQKKSLKQAERLFQKIINLDPSHVRAYLALAKAKALLGETSDLVHILHTAIERNPHALDLKLALVDRYLNINKIADAEGVLLDALQQDPGNSELQCVLATFYFRTGQIDKAESAYKKAIKLAPGKIKPLMRLARFYALTGDEEHAEKMYARGVNLAPGNVQILDAVARFYARNGKMEQAENYVHMALKANPSFLPSRILQMELAFKRGNFDEVLRRSLILLREGKKFPKIYYLRGMALLAKGKSQEAEEVLLHAIDGWPGRVRAKIGLARAYFDRGDYKKARAQAKSALKQLPHSLDARLVLGSIASRMGDLDLASRYYQDALRINPDYGPAANNLAYLLVKQGKNLDEALRLARHAHHIIPKDSSALDTLGWIHYKRGEITQAVSLLAENVAKYPRNPVFLYHLGMAYLKQGKNLRAREALEKALGVSKKFEGAQEARAKLSELGSVEKKTGPEERRGK